MTLPLSETSVDISSASGQRLGCMRVSLLPNYSGTVGPAPLARGQGMDGEEGFSNVLLLEGTEYRYEFEFVGASPSKVKTDRQELFTPDRQDGLTGRLRTGLFTGTLPVTVFADGSDFGVFEVEVRAKKLDYLREYRWMLRDVALDAAELVMEKFAATEHRFTTDFGTDPQTLYQRFAFLRSLVHSEDVTAGLQRVLSRPHIAWEQLLTRQSPAKGWPPGSTAAREVARAKHRTFVPTLPEPLNRVGIPTTVSIQRTEATVDNTPNRFVKYALERWRDIITSIEERLQHSAGPSIERGLRETSAVRDFLDGILAHELFREVGSLTRFPADDQVLLKSEGYRDIYRAYVLFEAAARLSWHGGEDVYRAGQKNVAILYEYWSYMQLAKLLEQLCDPGFNRESLVRLSPDGMNLELVRGVEQTLRGNAERLGRVLTLKLWFNRTFSSGPHGSWTRAMRPDCSLLITCEEGASSTFEPVVVHFDAKYRVEAFSALFSADGAPFDSTEAGVQTQIAGGQALREDLLKMHAYRDAIRRSAGAYVLYPGTKNYMRPEYHELLPGLGAFALRPTETGDVFGAGALLGFLDAVLLHVASQVSQHERGRYWRRRSFAGNPPSAVTPAASFLTQPPADTLVLLGYVKNRAHIEWIHQQRRYNLRADERRGAVGIGHRSLASELLLLYSAPLGLLELWTVRGEPELVSRAEIEALGYPQPRGRAYLCLTLEEDLSQFLPSDSSIEQILDVRERSSPGAPRGVPVATSWYELVR